MTGLAVTAAHVDWMNIGKVFGKLGTGKWNQGDTSGIKAFRSTVLATAKNYMLWSLFPNGPTVTFTASTTYTAKELTLAATTEYNAPGGVTAAGNPDAAIGAKALAAGFAAAAVIATLY